MRTGRRPERLISHLQSSSQALVRPLSLGDALIDGLAARKTFFHPVPLRDAFLSQLPAKQDRAAFDRAGEVQQADIDIFDLHPDGINFRQRIAHTLLSLDALRLATGQGNSIYRSYAVHNDAMVYALHLAFNLLHQILTSD